MSRRTEIHFTDFSFWSTTKRKSVLLLVINFVCLTESCFPRVKADFATNSFFICLFSGEGRPVIPHLNIPVSGTICSALGDALVQRLAVQKLKTSVLILKMQKLILSGMFFLMFF